MNTSKPLIDLHSEKSSYFTGFKSMRSWFRVSDQIFIDPDQLAETMESGFRSYRMPISCYAWGFRVKTLCYVFSPDFFLDFSELKIWIELSREISNQSLCFFKYIISTSLPENLLSTWTLGISPSSTKITTCVFIKTPNILSSSL